MRTLYKNARLIDANTDHPGSIFVTGDTIEAYCRRMLPPLVTLPLMQAGCAYRLRLLTCTATCETPAIRKRRPWKRG